MDNIIKASNKLLSNKSVTQIINKYNIKSTSKNNLDMLDIHAFLGDTIVNTYMINRLHQFDLIAKDKNWDNNRYREEMMYDFLNQQEKNNIMELRNDINNVSTLLVNCLNTDDELTKEFKEAVIEFNNDVITLNDNLFKEIYDDQVVTIISNICGKYNMETDIMLPEVPTCKVTNGVKLAPLVN